MPGVDEVAKEVIKAVVLTPKVALWLRAKVTYVDRFQQAHRKAHTLLLQKLNV